MVSKIANFAIDLPEANVAIQLSGQFVSRQEEAQRLGRILRPKTDGGQASFYTIVTRETVDQAFAATRPLGAESRSASRSYLGPDHLQPNGLAGGSGPAAWPCPVGTEAVRAMLATFISWQPAFDVGARTTPWVPWGQSAPGGNGAGARRRAALVPVHFHAAREAR